MDYESLEACSNYENSTLCEISHSAVDPILYRIIGVFNNKFKLKDNYFNISVI